MTNGIAYLKKIALLCPNQFLLTMKKLLVLLFVFTYVVVEAQPTIAFKAPEGVICSAVFHIDSLMLANGFTRDTVRPSVKYFCVMSACYSRKVDTGMVKADYAYKYVSSKTIYPFLMTQLWNNMSGEQIMKVLLKNVKQEVVRKDAGETLKAYYHPCDGVTTRIVVYGNSSMIETYNNLIEWK